MKVWSSDNSSKVFLIVNCEFIITALTLDHAILDDAIARDDIADAFYCLTVVILNVIRILAMIRMTMIFILMILSVMMILAMMVYLC